MPPNRMNVIFLSGELALTESVMDGNKSTVRTDAAVDVVKQCP